MLAEPYQTGSGVFWAGFKMPPAIQRRIDWIGCMDDEVKKCLATNDSDGLRRLASEYAAHNMMQTATRIMLLVDNKEGGSK
jgi:hypothetical protein